MGTAVIIPNVRAEKNPDPSSIPGLKAWFDFNDPSTLFTDAGSTNVSADGDPIQQVNDKSGHSATLSSSGTARPLFKPSVLGDRSVARFDGSNDTLQSGVLAALTVPQDLFVVVRYTGSAGAGAAHFVAGGATGSRTIEISKNPASDALAMQGNLTLTSTTAMGSSWQIVLGRWNGASSSLYQNGASIATGDTGGNSALGITLGSWKDGTSNPFPGDIAEYLLFAAGALSTANINAMGKYLASKWGLTWTAVT